MQVGRPDKGTGEPCGSPHRRPNWVAGVDGRKNSRIAGGSSAFVPGFQTRLPMWGSGERIRP